MNEGIKNTGPDAHEDMALIEAFKAKDASAFDRLVIKYKDRVFNLCYRLLGNHADSDDSAQEVFIKVYRSLKNFRFESTFSTWLYRIAVNTCKNRLASMKYRRNLSMVRLDKPVDTEENAHPVEIGDPASPAVELARMEKEAAITDAINSLPKEQKEVVVLRDVEGLSYEEVAEITGYNLGTLKSKLARARLRLREKLKGLV